ncbi:MAG: hypothetical protein VB021_02655, partial [Oscillospiraceae bacterium]|nr:hypothetical protein [Oscillospiraceae bacterium]
MKTNRPISVQKYGQNDTSASHPVQSNVYAAQQTAQVDISQNAGIDAATDTSGIKAVQPYDAGIKTVQPYNSNVLTNSDNSDYNQNRGEIHGKQSNKQADQGDYSGRAAEGAESSRESIGNGSNESRQNTAGTQRVFRQPVINDADYARAGATTTQFRETTNDPDTFTAALDTAIKENKHGLMVSPKTAQELADNGAITFMSADGKAGAAVTRGGDIEAVFRIPGGNEKRLSYQMVITAIENGGCKLDCYGEELAQNYSRMGMIPVAKAKFNPDYAPVGWAYGPKDIYAMMLKEGETASSVAQKLGIDEEHGGFHMPTVDELNALPVMEYDEAIAYRDRLLKSKTSDDRFKTGSDATKGETGKSSEVSTNIIRANSQNSQGPTNPNASQAADANGAGFSLPQSKQILPYNDTRMLDTFMPQSYDPEELASIPKAETIDGKSPLENENVKEMLGEVERGEAGSISVDVPIEIAQANTGKGVGYNKDIQRNIEAATSGNTVTHEWFMKNVLEPLENAKAAISEAMYDILPKYKADMERLGIKKGSKE